MHEPLRAAPPQQPRASRRAALRLLGGAAASALALHPAQDALAADRDRGLAVPRFGAAGDGLRDDTAPIQRALDLAGSAGGGLVTVPAGTYRTTAPLRVASNVTLGMQHDATILRDFKRQGIDGATIQNDNQDPAVGNTAVAVWGGTLRASGPSAIGKHFGFANVSSLTIANVRLAEVFADWHIALQAVTNALILAVNIDGGNAISEDGIHVLSGSFITISGCSVHCGDDAISLTAENPALGDISDVTVEDCRVFSNSANAVRIHSTTDHTVSRVRMRHLTGSVAGSHAILIQDPSGRGLVRDVVLEDVSIDTSQALATGALINGVNDVALVRVSFGKTRGRPFHIQNCVGVTLKDCDGTPGLPDLQSVLVENSRAIIVDGFKSDGATQHGLVLSGVDGAELRACTVSNARNAGAQLLNSTNVRIVGCICRDCNFGIELDGATSGNQFSSNRLEGNRLGPLIGNLSPGDIWLGNTGTGPNAPDTSAILSGG